MSTALNAQTEVIVTCALVVRYSRIRSTRAVDSACSTLRPTISSQRPMSGPFTWKPVAAIAMPTTLTSSTARISTRAVRGTSQSFQPRSQPTGVRRRDPSGVKLRSDIASTDLRNSMEGGQVG